MGHLGGAFILQIDDHILQDAIGEGLFAVLGEDTVLYRQRGTSDLGHPGIDVDTADPDDRAVKVLFCRAEEEANPLLRDFS